MTTQTPLILANGRTRQIPVGDTLPASCIPTNSLGLIQQGLHTIWIPATALIVRTTNGAVFGSTETATNKIMIRTLNFDPATAKYAQFSIRMPKSWDLGFLTAVFVWSHSATTSNFGVVWGLQGVAFSDQDPLDAAFSASQTVIDTGGITDTIYQSASTPNIVVSGTLVYGDLVIFQVYRDATHVSDTLAVPARLHGVVVLYTINAATDI